MGTDRVVSRKGIFLQYVLFAAVFAPTLMLLTERWVGWLFSQLIGPIVVYIFMQSFPKLSQYKSYYYASQILGLFSGLIVFELPSERLTVVFVWLCCAVFSFSKPVLGAIYILSGKIKSEHITDQNK